MTTHTGANYITQQHRSDVSNSRHIIALGADHDSIRLSYRWLTHLGLVKRTYLSDELHGLLLTPDKGGRNDVSEGASLRVARKRNEHMWDVDLTSYSHTRQSEPGQANSLGPFDKFRYTQKAPGLLRNRPNTNQTAAKRLQPGVRDSKTKIPTSYASAAGGAGRGHSQTRPAAPALRAPSTTTSEVSGAGRVTSTAPSASSNSRPPTLVERVLANRPKAPRNQNNGQDSATKLHLQKWVDEIGASNQQDLGDLISFDEPNQAGLTPSSPPPPPVASATPSSSKKTERLGGSKEDVSGNLLDEGSDHSEDLIDFGPSDEPVDQPGFNIQNETHGKINPELVGESDLQAQFGREETSVIEFHETMNQKAGRRSQAKNQQGSACQPLPGASKPPVPGAPPKPDDSLGMSSSAPSALLKSQLLNDMKARVQSVAQNLQIVSGEVGLEIKIGRLYIRNPLSSTISANAVVSSDLVWKLDAATQELHQISPKDIGFQPVLSARGADANLLVQLREPGEPRWNPPTTSVVYRFICRHVGTGIWFKVDVDTVSFAHICQGLDEEVENVYIHCPECAWDMKICATRARIEFPEQYAKDFAKFAEGLIKSLEVS